MHKRYILIFVVIVILFLFVQRSQGQTAVIYSEGFESGNLSNWDSYKNTDGVDLSITSTEAYQGLYSLKFTINDTSQLLVRKTTNPPFTGQKEDTITYYLKVANGFTLPNNPSPNNEFIIHPGGGCYQSLPGQVWLWNDNGTLKIRFKHQIDSCYGQPLAATPITTGVWHKISVYSKVADAGQSNGIVRGYVDDILIGETTTNNNNRNSVGLNGIYFIANNIPVGTAGTFYIDDVSITATASQISTPTPTPTPPPIDTTPPTVSITAPVLGSTVFGNTTISATASDNVGVTGVTFFYDTLNQIADVLTSPFTAIWNTTGVVNGPHSLIAIARDVAGNKTTSNPPVSVTVSNTISSKKIYVAALSTSCNPASPGSGTIADPYTNPYYALTQGTVTCGDTVQLRGGTYRIKVNGFQRDSTPQDGYNLCDDDQTHTGGYDGGHTIIPLFKQCSAANPLIIENYPNEDVIIDGTDVDMDNGNVWTLCESISQCGPATGLNLEDYTKTYYTTAFNVSNADTPQIWIDPTPTTPGIRVQWWADSSGSKASDLAADHDSLTGGTRGQFFSVNSGNPIVIRLADGSNPNNHSIKLTCQSGDCAYSGVSSYNASYITVRKNPIGGSLRAKYSYYPIMISGDSQHIIFNGVEIIAAGGRDYGQCLRTSDGDYITFKNGLCRESMAEGIAHYGGGPVQGIQLVGNVIENSIIYDTGLGWIDGGGAGSSLGQGAILKNCKDCFVRNNTIYNSFRNGIQVNTSDSCSGAPCDSSNVIIEGNTVYNSCHFVNQSQSQSIYPWTVDGQTDCAAIYLSPAPFGVLNSASIRNNFVRGAYSPVFTNGSAPYGIYLDGNIPNASIENNSINNLGGACINVRQNINSVTIRNNAMNQCSTTGTGGCSGSRCNLFLSPGVAYPTRNNTYWSANNSDVVVFIPGITSYTRSNITTFEPSAVQFDPLFVSPTNLHLQSVSQLINRGLTLLNFTNDFDNDTRPKGLAWDIGADEYTSTIMTTPTPTPTLTPIPTVTPTPTPTPTINPISSITPAPTIIPTSTLTGGSGSGGGGGGGGTTSPTPTPPSTSGPTPSPENPCGITGQGTLPLTSGITITRALYVGVIKGEDIKILQQYLNHIGYTVSISGPGSISNETNHFGSATRMALRKFQCAKLNICSGSEGTNGYGVVGPKTRKALQGGGMGSASSPQASSNCPTPTPTQSTQVGKFIIGNRIRVSASTVNLRISPNGPVKDKIIKNTQGIIKKGPINYYGFIWYEITYASGVTGWSAEASGNTQLLVGM